MVLGAIPAGVITDRYDRQNLMVGADIFRMILTLGLLTCAVMPPLLAPPEATFAAIVMVSGLAFLLGVAEVLRDNAAKTVMQSIVPSAAL
tara:strand:- start:1455 stop:1724 length:270 start_codon:yes stop_codon:yes gene_type:complete